MMRSYIPLLLPLFFLTNVCFCIIGCIESERVALLEFKNGLIDPSNRLFDWVPHSSDCCNWTGVVCDNLTSHVLQLHLRTLSLQEYLGPDEVIFVSNNEDTEYEEYRSKSALGGKVSASLLKLEYLCYLDLSYNDFGGAPIPKFIGSMRSLRYLNLSSAGFGGTIPPQLGNLSNLNYLNLHSSSSLQVETLDWVTDLSSLEFLDLGSISLSQSHGWFKVMNSLPSLVELHLSFCSLSVFDPSSTRDLNFSSLAILDFSYNDFEGQIPNHLQNMSSFLRELDLSWNYFNSSIPIWLYDLTHLRLLNLRFNWLQGQVSSGMGNLTLTNLDLSYNDDLHLEKGIPNSFEKFCNLRSLSLSYVKFDQGINDVLAILSTCASSILQYLDLSNCQLSGHLTDDLIHFKNIVVFVVSNNSISGPIPLSLGNLNKLEQVDISNNNLEGEVSQLHFENLTRLVIFEASRMKNKSISLRVSPKWIPPLQLAILDLGSWKIRSKFPKWLRPLTHLTSLDLSDCEISSSVPIWFWDSLHNYFYLNFSHNQMHGTIPTISFISGYMPLIDLSSNRFTGEIPYFSSNTYALDLSHNLFSGSIFKFLCDKMNEEKQMLILNLEGNLLSGEIPNCWGSWRNLAAVKLSNNSFNSNIPVSIGTLTELEALHLRNNNFSGDVPSSIQNCTNLFLLDISENNLEGKIQTWIGDGFSKLRILSLRANKFDGNLSEELCHLISLQILDLSHNRLFGAIPSCFGDFNAMARSDSSGQIYVYSRLTGDIGSTSLLMKGKMMEYSTNLGFVRSIDISSNNIFGEIPRELTNLTELLSLNLSHNSLIGRIPDNIGDMKGLEAIDFSHNRLYGEIPQSMSSLTFLGILDLSYNNFSGRIPSGTQLQSFNSSSFVGNHLCGPPLPDNCIPNNTHPGSHKEEDDGSVDEVDVWFYGSMVLGFVVGFWSIVGSLVFIKKWRHFCFRSAYHLSENFIATFR